MFIGCKIYRLFPLGSTINDGRSKCCPSGKTINSELRWKDYSSLQKVLDRSYPGYLTMIPESYLKMYPFEEWEYSYDISEKCRECSIFL